MLKKQNYNLQAPTEQQMQNMHLGFKTVVKKIGGVIIMNESHNQLQKYMRNSLIVKRRILEENGCAKQVKDYYDQHLEIFKKMCGANSLKLRYMQNFIKNSPNKEYASFKNIEDMTLKIQIGVSLAVQYKNHDSRNFRYLDLQQVKDFVLYENQNQTLGTQPLTVPDLIPMLLVNRQPLLDQYQRNVNPKRARLHNHLKGAVSSFNEVVDKYLRSNQADQFKMLTTGNYFRLVELLRQHELLELTILDSQFIKADELIQEYIENIKLPIKNWHLNELQNFQFQLKEIDLQVNNLDLWWELKYYSGEISYAEYCKKGQPVIRQSQPILRINQSRQSLNLNSRQNSNRGLIQTVFQMVPAQRVPQNIPFNRIVYQDISQNAQNQGQNHFEDEGQIQENHQNIQNIASLKYPDADPIVCMICLENRKTQTQETGQRKAKFTGCEICNWLCCLKCYFKNKDINRAKEDLSCPQCKFLVVHHTDKDAIEFGKNTYHKRQIEQNEDPDSFSSIDSDDYQDYQVESESPERNTSEYVPSSNPSGESNQRIGSQNIAPINIQNGNHVININQYGGNSRNSGRRERRI